MEMISLVVLQQLLTGHDARVVLGVAATEGILQALSLASVTPSLNLR